MENSVCTLFFNASLFCAQRKASALSNSEVSSSSASSGKDISCFFLPSFRGWNWPQSIPRISKFSTFYALSKIWRFNMGFNNGFEHVRLENKWKKLRIQYREAGMSEEAIQEMYNFDTRSTSRSTSISLLTLRGSDTSACKTVGHRTSIFKNNETARIGGCRPYACKIRHLADFQCDLQESKKKSTILPTKYSAFLVENSGIEPLTSCMPCKRSPS